MDLADYIAGHKGRLIERWKELAVERLALKLDESELANDLPDFVDEVVESLRHPEERWPAVEGAHSHGRHRMKNGVDMGALTEEMALITETVCELAAADGRELRCGEIQQLARVIARGTATSVNAYAALRDAEIERVARRHYSFIAHELRTPLSTARMTAGLLALEADCPHAQHLERLERSLRQLSELVDGFLGGVRLGGRPEVKVERVDVRALVDDAVEDVRLHARSKEIEIATDVEPLAIDGDVKLLASALSNLLKNAVKFTRAQSRVAVHARAQEARVLFEIDDECGGMPDDLPGRLFQPFFQAHDDKTGFGLGLMIVKQAAEAHQGSVRVANRPGQGCTFVLDLPRSLPADPMEG